MTNKPLIALTAGQSEEDLNLFLDAVERAGSEPWPLSVDYGLTPQEVLARAGALILSDGPDVNPAHYGKNPNSGVESADFDDARDEMEITLVRAALDADLPIYGVGRGMHVLNVALGGRLLQSVDGHYPPAPHENEDSKPAYHHIYISPGSKLAAVVGSGGFVRVNSRHRSGMREAQKSQHLLASAYSLEDGLIEALESPDHKWVIAVQFSPQRRMEIPPHFERLFQSLAERAAERLANVPDPINRV